jgi:hypothetical protein
MAHCEKLLVYKIGWGSPVGLVGGDCGDCFYSREGLATLSPRSRYPQGCNDTRSKYSLATRELMSCEACHLEPNEVRVNQKKNRKQNSAQNETLLSAAIVVFDSRHFGRAVQIYMSNCLSTLRYKGSRIRPTGSKRVTQYFHNFTSKLNLVTKGL